MKQEPRKIETEGDDVATYSYGEAKIHIWRDPDADSPRTWDNVWKWWCAWPREFNPVDEDDNVRCVFRARLERDGFYEDHPGNTEELIKWLEEKYPDEWFHPIYGVSHGGTTITWTRWIEDSGVAYIASCKKSKAKEEWPCVPEEKLRDRAIEYLKTEFDSMKKWMDDEVVGYTIENAVGETSDSCGGFFDMDDCLEQACEAVSEKDRTMKLFDGFGILEELNKRGRHLYRIAFIEEASDEKCFSVGCMFEGRDGLDPPQPANDGDMFAYYVPETLAGMLGYGRGELHGSVLKCWNGD